MEKLDHLKFDAILFKAQTTVDGGWRITLDVDNSQSALIAILAQLRERLLHITIEAGQQPWED